MDHRAFAEKLVNGGFLATLELEPARPAAGGRPSWGKHLLAASRMKPADFADLLAATQGLPRAGLDAMRRGTSLAGEFSTTFLHEAGLFPYRGADGGLRLAAADPFDADAVDAVAITLGEGVVLEVASFEDVEIALDAGVRAEEAEGEGAEAGRGADEARDNSDSLRDLASGAPVVRALDDVFDQAVALRASDIHVEPLGRDVQIRVRVDGVLRLIPAPRAAPARALVSRIKILAGLNIAEHRQPQDGRMRIAVRGAISTCASPPCRRRGAKPPSCACWTGGAASSPSRISASTRATAPS